MTYNHLPGGAPLTDFGRSSLPDLIQPGTGFGLGFAVLTDPVAAKFRRCGQLLLGRRRLHVVLRGSADEVTMVFLTQLLPSSTHPSAGNCASSSRRPSSTDRMIESSGHGLVE